MATLTLITADESVRVTTFSPDSDGNVVPSESIVGPDSERSFTIDATHAVAFDVQTGPSD